MDSFITRNKKIFNNSRQLFDLLEKLSPWSKELSLAEIIKSFMNTYNETLRLCTEQPIYLQHQMSWTDELKIKDPLDLDRDNRHILDTTLVFLSDKRIISYWKHPYSAIQSIQLGCIHRVSWCQRRTSVLRIIISFISTQKSNETHPFQGKTELRSRKYPFQTTEILFIVKSNYWKMNIIFSDLKKLKKKHY